MRVSRPVSLSVQLMVLLCVALIGASVWAQQTTPAQQQPPEGPKPQANAVTQMPPPSKYSKGVSAWSIIGPYKPQTGKPPVLTNTQRIDQLLQNGKLMLSLNDAITLALENNLDLAIARFNNIIADTDILRAKAGSATRGVNTGLVQGTPGGGGVGTTGSTGGGAGGTTTGAGGAGAGTGGIVASTLGAGAPIPSFDPILTGTLQIEHSRTAQANPFLTGTDSLAVNTGLADFNYQQGFQTGTLLNVGFNNSRTTLNSIRGTLNPQINSNFRATITQPLLSGCCMFVNRRNIISANYNKQISDIAFENQVISTVAQIQDIYWDLVNAYEDFRVKERSLALAQKTLSDNQKQVQIGTLAPIEVVRAQSAVAAANQDLIISQTNLQLQQLLMKNAITRNLQDPTLAAAPVIPTDRMQITDEQMPPVEELVKDALKQRPDINSQRIDLKNREISKKATRNALLPSLDLIGFYGGSGLTGDPNTLSGLVCGQPNAPPPPDCIPNIRRGYGGALGDSFDSTNPDKGVALQLTIPLRNRSAQADQVRAELEYRQAQMRLQQLENQITIEVRNAQYAVQQNRGRVEAAQAARELQAQSLDAEQKKYALGASTNTLVLQAQRDLTQAEVNLVAAQAAYEKSRVELDRVTGFTLNRLGIILNDAATGQVTSMPHVPGVVTAEPVQQQK